MSGKRIGYVRVSTIDQNPERQLEGVDLDKKFIEYASGTSLKRPQLQCMLNYIRDDDIIFVDSMDRLARNVKDLRELIDSLTSHKIKIHFIKESLTFTGEDSPMSKLLLTIMGAVAEFEHAIIRERMLEGIAIAKAKGKYKGRQRCMNNEKIEILRTLLQTRRTLTDISMELKVSRGVLYKYIKEYDLPYICKKNNINKKQQQTTI